MKTSCNVKQGTSLVKNSTKKANTNTSPDMKISCNVKQGTSLVMDCSQTVEIKDKTNEKSHI